MAAVSVPAKRFDRGHWFPSNASDDMLPILARVAQGRRISCCCREDPNKDWSQTGRTHGSLHKFGGQVIFNWQSGLTESFPLTGVAWGTRVLVYKDDLNPISDDKFVPRRGGYRREDKAAFVSELSTKIKDGQILRCRGRDSESEAWDYGWCKKKGDQMLFFYVNGDEEANRIGWFAWGPLVQVLQEDLNYTPKAVLRPDASYDGPCIEKNSANTQRTFCRMWYFNDKWKSIAARSCSTALCEQTYEDVMKRGCVGMTALVTANKSVIHPVQGAYTPLKGYHEFEVARSVWLSQAHEGCCLFAICFWSNPGQRQPDPSAFLPNEDGMVDITKWFNYSGHQGRVTKDGRGKHVNFDYGWYEPGSGIWHANHNHKSRRLRDDIKEPMLCYQSTVEQFREELTEPLETREFDRCVWFISESRFGLARHLGSTHSDIRERGTSGPWGNVGAYNPRKSSTNPPVFVPNPSELGKFRKFCTPWMTESQGAAKCPLAPQRVPTPGDIQTAKSGGA